MPCLFIEMMIYGIMPRIDTIILVIMFSMTFVGKENQPDQMKLMFLLDIFIIIQGLIQSQSWFFLLDHHLYLENGKHSKIFLSSDIYQNTIRGLSECRYISALLISQIHFCVITAQSCPSPVLLELTFWQCNITTYDLLSATMPQMVNRSGHEAVVHLAPLVPACRVVCQWGGRLTGQRRGKSGWLGMMGWLGSDYWWQKWVPPISCDPAWPFHTLLGPLGLASANAACISTASANAACISTAQLHQCKWRVIGLGHHTDPQKHGATHGIYFDCILHLK